MEPRVRDRHLGHSGCDRCGGESFIKMSFAFCVAWGFGSWVVHLAPLGGCMLGHIQAVWGFVLGGAIWIHPARV